MKSLSDPPSQVLLVLYMLYLLFQLKSHAYLYEGISQQRIDEESHPGVLANIMGSSHSPSSSSSSDTDSSAGSRSRARRIRRALRKGRKSRKSSVDSHGVNVVTAAARGNSAGSGENNVAKMRMGAEGLPVRSIPSEEQVPRLVFSGDEVDTEGARITSRESSQEKVVNFPDAEDEHPEDKKAGQKRGEYGRRSKRTSEQETAKEEHNVAKGMAFHQRCLNLVVSTGEAARSRRRAGITASEIPSDRDGMELHHSRAPFTVRTVSIRSVMPNSLAAVDSPPSRGSPALDSNLSDPVNSPSPSGLHRTISLPERLNQHNPIGLASSAQPPPYITPTRRLSLGTDENDDDNDVHISKTAAIIVLVISTALVAVCAEFLVGSINSLLDDTGLNEVFVGLIILPVVGNTAELITAVTVATKNKMDLAIGVAVGSSIQIGMSRTCRRCSTPPALFRSLPSSDKLTPSRTALFVTPVVVLLGWILHKDMSLLFSLFQTICLFVSAFIVNFLVLDGRSNYLEGALLFATYVIIA